MKNNRTKLFISRQFTRIIFASALLLLSGFTFSSVAQAEDLSQWKLPLVPIPADNPQSKAKIKLGHQLFFDIRLSKDNNTISCDSCHVPFAGISGHTPRGFGHTGEQGRWTPSLVNTGYSTTQFWDGSAASLEQQTGGLLGHMGAIIGPHEQDADIVQTAKLLNLIPEYKKEFHMAFGEDATRENIAKAIASYERTFVARHSPFQRYVNGDSKALSPAAKRGFKLFRTKARCAECHTAPLMTDNDFHNIGVPQVGPMKVDLGRYDVTHNKSDMRAFKTPTLYNSSSLMYFMHDGVFSTMDQVMDHYNKGGDPNDAQQSKLIVPLHLTKKEKSDLITFMNSLTDTSLNRIHRPLLP